MHKDMDVWKVAMELVEEIYRLTKGFPKEEMYGLSSQLRRAAVSIPSNIAEGAARQTRKEYIQFLYYAQGSMSELETQLDLSNRLSYLTAESLTKIEDIRERVGKMLYGLIRKLKRPS